jgi:NAD(P)-dependent dehydrogenase (short-subunit alcohol dehydrogenase family)
MHDPYAGRIAIVTGAGSGIGAALAAALASRGARVVASDLDPAAAAATAARLAAAGHAVRAATLDVTDAAAFRALVDETLDREGRLDLLFNNAGVGVAGETRDLTLDDWRPAIDVNLWGVIHGVAAAYPRLVAQGSGHIVNTASGAGLVPRPGMVAYAAAKHAVVGLSLSLRAEAGAHGVRVSVVCPGYIDTNIFRATRFVNVDGRALMALVPIRPMSPAACARIVLRGVARDRPIIVVSRLLRVEWLIHRLSPALSLRLAGWRARRFREQRRDERARGRA